jgi:photosystem II stability/assembly factor-like uncharacterized protein
MDVAYRAGGGEPGYIAPDPKDVDVFYSGTNNGRYVDKFNRKHGTTREVNPYPWFYSGEPAIDLVERWQWTFPIIFSPIDPNRLYVSSQRLWMTTDAGASWTALSGDLTRADPMTLQHSGGPITGDMNGPEVYATIFSVGPGKTDVDVIWTGSDDGLVHVTQDGGDTWSNVTPPGMPDFGRVSQIDASAFARGGAYVSVRLPLLDDFSPYIFKTEDYGQTWTKIVNGIREDAYVNAVREDPDRVGLLYAATQHGVYISYDDGAMWQELNPSFPDIPVVDVIAKDNELVIGTHGRGFWVLDNFGPLRQATPNMTAEAVELFNPPLAVRSAPGVSLAWWLRDTPNEAKLEILDSEGEVLRTFEPAPPEDDDEPAEGRGGRGGGGPRLSTDPGLNHLTWDLRTEPWTNFEGMIFWGAPRMGPAVPPGQYSVRLTIDGRTESAPLTVERNPWIPEVSDEDLRAQYEFSRQVRDKVTEANQAVIAIRRVMAQLQDRLDQSDDLGLAEAAESLTGNASAVEADIYQVRNQSNQDPLNFPIKVNNRLANLMSMAERGDGRPMNNMSEIFDILVNELRGYTDRLEDVWATDLAAVNAELVRLEMMPLDPDCDRPEGCVIA